MSAIQSGGVDDSGPDIYPFVLAILSVSNDSIQ
jgi:hypothetical protein